MSLSCDYQEILRRERDVTSVGAVFLGGTKSNETARLGWSHVREGPAEVPQHLLFPRLVIVISFQNVSNGMISSKLAILLAFLAGGAPCNSSS